MKTNEKGITVKKAENFSEWYTQVITKAELVEYTDVSGCMVYRPYSFAMWDTIKGFLDARLKALGVQNAYFPIFIPEHLLTKEKDHVEGFSPEVAWVTHGGNSKLPERLAVRPTSETIMYDSYSKWIKSYHDLPLLINQWVNIVRWEFKHPMPFLRGREFLWQEGHTVFASRAEAEAETFVILDKYTEVFEDLLSVPVMKGKKSEKEKFAGAVYTNSVEAMFPDGKAIQGGTTHMLGQNFAKSFDIIYTDENQKKQHPWQNSWGLSTRSIGMMLAIHGDDKGLVLPPKIAPIQVVIVPIIFEKTKDEVLAKSNEIQEQLAGDLRVKLDSRDNYSPGWKFNQWEMKGVPIRIELGPKDLDKGHVMVARRDTGEKFPVLFADVKSKVKELAETIQKDLFTKAKKFLEDNIVKTDDFEAMKSIISSKKFALVPWCGARECEEAIKDIIPGAKSLNTPFDQKNPGKKCVHCDKDAVAYTHFGKSY